MSLSKWNSTEPGCRFCAVSFIVHERKQTVNQGTGFVVITFPVTGFAVLEFRVVGWFACPKGLPSSDGVADLGHKLVGIGGLVGTDVVDVKGRVVEFIAIVRHSVCDSLHNRVHLIV